VRNKRTNIICALKLVEKTTINETENFNIILSELSVMRKLSNRFLTQLYYAFESN